MKNTLKGTRPLDVIKYWMEELDIRGKMLDTAVIVYPNRTNWTMDKFNYDSDNEKFSMIDTDDNYTAPEPLDAHHEVKYFVRFNYDNRACVCVTQESGNTYMMTDLYDKELQINKYDFIGPDGTLYDLLAHMRGKEDLKEQLGHTVKNKYQKLTCQTSLDYNNKNIIFPFWLMQTGRNDDHITINTINGNNKSRDIYGRDKIVARLAELIKKNALIAGEYEIAVYTDDVYSNDWHKYKFIPIYEDGHIVADSPSSWSCAPHEMKKYNRAADDADLLHYKSEDAYLCVLVYLGKTMPFTVSFDGQQIRTSEVYNDMCDVLKNNLKKASKFGVK